MEGGGRTVWSHRCDVRNINTATCNGGDSTPTQRQWLQHGSTPQLLPSTALLPDLSNMVSCHLIKKSSSTYSFKSSSPLSPACQTRSHREVVGSTLQVKARLEGRCPSLLAYASFIYYNPSPPIILPPNTTQRLSRSSLFSFVLLVPIGYSFAFVPTFIVL